MNRNGQKLTRAGVTYILNKYAKAASVIDPSIPEKIPPHLMRHTKAMHIYDADILHIPVIIPCAILPIGEYSSAPFSS